MPKKNSKPIEGVKDIHRKVISNYIINGFNKAKACEQAGLSKHSAPDVFNRPEVQAEIERRLQVSEEKTDMDRKWLLDKLRDIIEASPGDLLEFDEKGRPSLDWQKLSPQLRRAIRKVTIDSSREGGKYKRTHTHVSIDPYDKIAAIKEAATLLGLREKKTTVQVDEQIIDILQQRRSANRKEQDDA